VYHKLVETSHHTLTGVIENPAIPVARLETRGQCNQGSGGETEDVERLGRLE